MIVPILERDWELEIEWLRGGYLWRLYRDGLLHDQGRQLDLWDAIHRAAYRAVIWPMRLN